MKYYIELEIESDKNIEWMIMKIDRLNRDTNLEIIRRKVELHE